MSGGTVDLSAGPRASRPGRLASASAVLAGGEVALAVAALLIVALHAIDDNFLQPQPGTSASDHLAAGLIPAFILLAVAAMYPRLSGGWRGSLAVLLGVFGVTVGVEAIYYLRAGHFSGDDYTGLAAIPAGLLLIGLGVRTLWRTRRVDDRLPRRYLRRALIAVGVAVSIYLLAAPFLASYVLTHAARAFVPRDRLGATHEDVSFTTSDGLRLRGWYVPSKNGAAVISFPGRKGTQKPARMLARHGYGVLLFDRRGEGESDGDPNGWGWGGYRDVDAAVRFLERRPDVEQGRIGGIGLSVGGEMMLEAAARTHSLDAIVSEGAGERSIRELLDMTNASRWIGLPSFVTLTTGVALFSNDAPPPSLKDLVARISPTPVFFVYGEHGQPGERNLNPTYYASAAAPKKIWEVPGSGHVGGITARPHEYERRVVGFFDRALLGDS
jgi:dienelactone hydrolase